jgi:hypothetical protein
MGHRTRKRQKKKKKYPSTWLRKTEEDKQLGRDRYRQGDNIKPDRK